MRFNLISNLANGVGLQQDYELLRGELEARGHTVHGVQFNAKPPNPKTADVNIFLEVVTPEVFAFAPKQWAVPNPEWWFQGWDPYPWDLVLAKTHDCERIFRAKVGSRCQYLGWMARDLYQDLPRQRKFLHVAGKSRFKNTPAVVAGCQHAGVPLTVVGEYAGVGHRRVSDQELTTLMNTHFCHIMPSAYEGYGHVLHEARGTGQIIITTDAPPMNEMEPSVLVPSVGTTIHHAGLLHKILPWDVSKAVRTVCDFSELAVQAYRDDARASFCDEVRQFHAALDQLVGRAS